MTTQTTASDPIAILNERFQNAIAAAFPDTFPDPSSVDPRLAIGKNPKLGDFQSNAAMALAKQLGKKPQDVAKAIIEQTDLSGIALPLDDQAIAGPGFINIKLDTHAIANLLTQMDSPKLGIPDPEKVETIVVDLCGVNLAKQMHVGHLRATVVGDAIARSLEALGHKVIRQNHVGDWGLPIAMVTHALMRESKAGTIQLDKLTLDELDTLYRRAQADCKADRRGLDAARNKSKNWDHPKALAELEAQVEGAEHELDQAKKTLVRLQSGDPEVVQTWQTIYDTTMNACLATCQRLHAKVTHEATAGESTYRDELASVVDDLMSREVAKEDQGALIIENADDKGKSFEPTIVRKSDGGFLYATTDLAAIRRRVQKFGADRVVYAVDARQALHFKQVFTSAQTAGYTHHAPGEDAQLVHAAFGMVLGEDGKPFKTRSGENVRLTALLDEAVTRAAEKVAETSPNLSEEDRAAVAEAVGIAAIKYADLSSERARDYVFSFDRMVSFQGNTGPYLLYALVRIKSLFRKAGLEPLQSSSAELALDHTAERALALKLLEYPNILQGVGDTYEPHRTCQFAYDLATTFSSFFESCPVLKSEGAVRESRLRLCSITGRVLEHALSTLGITTLERM